MFQDEQFSSNWENPSQETPISCAKEQNDSDLMSPSELSKEPNQLLCFCRSPQKEAEGTKDMHISYLVITQSNTSFVQKPMSAIRRRFSDFIYLYETLRIEFPTCCIPPLPDRHRMSLFFWDENRNINFLIEYIKGDRFSTEFAMKRANSLERFLQRVSLHPVLQKSVHLSHFFESQDWSSYAHNVIMQDKTHYISIGGVFEGLSDAFLNSFTKINNPNMLFIDMEERIDKLDCGLVHMEKLISKMIRQKIDLEMDYNGMAFLFKQLAVLEPSLSRELTMFSEVIENTETHLKTLVSRCFKTSIVINSMTTEGIHGFCLSNLHT